MRDCISSRRLISIRKGLQLVQMNQMQYFSWSNVHRKILHLIHLNQLQSFWDRREDVQSRNYASIKTKVTSLPKFNLPAYLVQDMIKQSEKIEAFE